MATTRNTFVSCVCKGSSNGGLIDSSVINQKVKLTVRQRTSIYTESNMFVRRMNVDSIQWVNQRYRGILTNSSILMLYYEVVQWSRMCTLVHYNIIWSSFYNYYT